jgi:hypothetical protein
MKRTEGIEYYKLAGQILEGEQPKLEEIIETFLEDDIGNMTIIEFIKFLKDNYNELLNFIM